MGKPNPLTALFSAHGIPEPETEVRFAPPRRWRWDYAWPKPYFVALEIQGGVWTRGRHTRGKGYISDMEKLNAGQVAGWIVLYCTPDQLLTGEACEWVRKALAVRGFED